MKRERFELTDLDRELLRHGLIFFIAISFVNVSNYVFHAVVSRVLGPPSYGALTGLLSFIVWISICAGAVQLVVARHVAGRRGPPDSSEDRTVSFRLILRHVSVGSAGLAILLGLLSPSIHDFLSLPSVASAYLLAAYVFPAALGACVRGVLQGQLQFQQLAAIVVGVAVTRVVLGVLLVELGFGVTGAVVATFAAEVAGLIAGWALIRTRGSLPDRSYRSASTLIRELITAIVAVGGFWAIISIDTPLARHYFPGAASGHYASAAIAAKLVLFFPVAIGTAVFPHFSAMSHTPGKSRQVLYRSLLVVLILSAGVATVLGIFPSLAVRMLFGSEYLPGQRLLKVLVVEMVLMSAVNLFVHYWLATGSRVVWITVPAALLQTAAIAAFHDSPLQIAVIVLLVAASLALAGAAVLLTSHPKVRPGVNEAYPESPGGVLIEHSHP